MIEVQKDKIIRLGVTVKDAATGYSGIVTAICTQLNGNIQAGVTPSSKDGAEPQGFYIDLNILDYIDSGVSDRVPPMREALFNLGDKLQDKVSKFKGIATEQIYYLSGCCFYTVITKSLKNNLAESLTIPQERLEKIGETELKKISKTKTGGPTRAMSSMRIR